jgi:hypothetical protein
MTMGALLFVEHTELVSHVPDTETHTTKNKKPVIKFTFAKNILIIQNCGAKLQKKFLFRIFAQKNFK